MRTHQALQPLLRHLQHRVQEICYWFLGLVARSVSGFGSVKGFQGDKDLNTSAVVISRPMGTLLHCCEDFVPASCGFRGRASRIKEYISHAYLTLLLSEAVENRHGHRKGQVLPLCSYPSIPWTGVLTAGFREPKRKLRD